MIFPLEITIKENKKLIKGLYIHKLEIKTTPNLTKNYIRELFYNSTELELINKKIDKEKTLIVIYISINKLGLIPLDKDLDKYDIFIDENNPFITWFGCNKITIKNEIKPNEDNIAKCKFSFVTTKKGLLEINKICILLYKRFEGMATSTGIMQINHITKPLYITID